MPSPLSICQPARHSTEREHIALPALRRCCLPRRPSRPSLGTERGAAIVQAGSRTSFVVGGIALGAKRRLQAGDFVPAVYDNVVMDVTILVASLLPDLVDKPLYILKLAAGTRS